MWFLTTCDMILFHLEKEKQYRISLHIKHYLFKCHIQTWSLSLSIDRTMVVVEKS